jgi:hypothetical protein
MNNVSRVLEDAILSVDKASSELTAESDDTQTASWPPTPASPDRLPSASLMDRLIDSASPRRPCFKDAESQFSEISFSRNMGPLIEVSRETVVRPLAQCSEPSPVISTFASILEAPFVQTRLRSAYPYNLSNIYDPVWPYITVYPAIQQHQAPPSLQQAPGQMNFSRKDAKDDCSIPPIIRKLQPGYHYNLAHIYESVWPYLSIYPSVTRTQSPPLRSCSRSLPAAAGSQAYR